MEAKTMIEIFELEQKNMVLNHRINQYEDVIKDLTKALNDAKSRIHNIKNQFGRGNRLAKFEEKTKATA